MNKHSSFGKTGSLLERAGEIYDYVPVRRDEAADGEGGARDVYRPAPIAPVAPTAASLPSVVHDGPTVTVDREKLREAGFIVPGGPVSEISEEFRIVKRQLLLGARGNAKSAPLAKGNRILIASAHPGEGKTFCALNLALSIAAEKENEVLLVDADFAKPSVPAALGLETGKGFMDALADPQTGIEGCVLHTDIAGLAILPAGERTNADTEYLASTRTEAVLERLTRNNPNRIIIFDSPPVLSASPASVLATHVGQVVMVVRADETIETALRDALSLMTGCDHVQLLLNGTKFSPTGRSFGSYYGYGE